jgi:hypothetical protein
VGQEDGDDEGAGAGCWMLDSRCLFLVSGHCLPVTKCIGSKVEGKRQRAQGARQRIKIRSFPYLNPRLTSYE